jgi:predicted metal-dependent peptidase
MNNNAVSQAIVKLFESERFYAEIVASMKRIISAKVPTAGVCIKNNIELHINPEWFSSRTPEERVAVLKHECEHLLRDHIPRFKQLAPEVFNNSKDIVDNMVSGLKFRSMNIGADMAINGNMKDLPKEGIFPQNFNLPAGETFEWYMSQLKGDKKQQQRIKGMGEGTFDPHAIWRESEDGKEIIKEKIRKAVNQAAQKTRAAGRMTAEHELLVAQLNPPSISWKQQLRRFVAKSIEIKVRESKKKRNRRYGVMYPGQVKEEVLVLGIAKDTSGSVNDEVLAQFDSEIAQIAKYAEVWVVDADTEIKQAYKYEPKKRKPNKGRGGTAYQPVFDYYNDKKNVQIDGLIYFGDMDCFDTEQIKKPKYPVLWAIVGSQEPPAKFGGKIYVKV